MYRSMFHGYMFRKLMYSGGRVIDCMPTRYCILIILYLQTHLPVFVLHDLSSASRSLHLATRADVIFYLHEISFTRLNTLVKLCRNTE